MIYERVLKEKAVVLAELQALAAVVDDVTVTGESLVVTTSAALTDSEKTAIANYNAQTMRTA